ncbi:MAG TPA: RNA-binding domain-containing protein [Chlamydiales bacterium]|jgi:ATP-dependent DNA helicase RecG|nr:RNA-binding domain-containing protein [Chlamydiales bacterium]
MNFNELFSLLQDSDETDRIEAKSASQGVGKSFLETVSAFCNEPDLGGGYILLGITRNETDSALRYIVTGVRDPDQLQQNIASQCRELFSVPIRPMIKTIPHPQGTVLLIYIGEATTHEKPVFIKKHGMDKGAYRRIGSSDQLCTREDLDFLYQLRSKRKYDETFVENASFTDFEPEAIKRYRYERAKVKADAPELFYGDEDLLKAVRAIETEKGVTSPTIGGLLLFGKQMSLRRLFPLMNQVDYMLVEGREWATDSEKRYTAFEMSEALITGIPRLIGQIMTDIPQVFALEEDKIRRKDNPIIPRMVIRESVVNALMHKDYRVISPTQIIKYANRTEFRNVGYSLKPQEQLGLPGSNLRNPILAQVFRDIHYAEGKGTGIGTMRDEMKKANLSVPLIESDRSSNLFVLTLLPHHLFDKEDIQWLQSFKQHNLTDEEARTLIIIREKGSISNAEYRTINGVDTLTASSHLRRLRDLGLLEQKGRGNATFYVPTTGLLTGGISSLAPHISPLSGELAPHISPLSGEQTSLPEGSLALPEELRKKITDLKKRMPPQEVKNLIKELCAVQPLKLSEISAILERHPKYVRENYLNDMIKLAELEHVFTDPSHPQQAYKAKK